MEVQSLNGAQLMMSWKMKNAMKKMTEYNEMGLNGDDDTTQ